MIKLKSILSDHKESDLAVKLVDGSTSLNGKTMIEMRTIIRKYDLNGDGEVNNTEILQVLKDQLKEKQRLARMQKVETIRLKKEEELQKDAKLVEGIINELCDADPLKRDSDWFSDKFEEIRLFGAASFPAISNFLDRNEDIDLKLKKPTTLRQELIKIVIGNESSAEQEQILKKLLSLKIEINALHRLQQVDFIFTVLDTKILTIF